MINVIDVDDLDAVAFGLLLGAARSGHAGELQAFLLHAATELVDQETHGRAGAQTCDHAVLNQLGSFDAGCFLQCVLLCLVHDPPSIWG